MSRRSACRGAMRALGLIFAGIFAVVFLLPTVLTISNSFMSERRSTPTTA